MSHVLALVDLHLSEVESWFNNPSVAVLGSGQFSVEVYFANLILPDKGLLMFSEFSSVSVMQLSLQTVLSRWI